MKPPTADTNRRPVESDKATSEKPATRQPARVVRVGGSVRTAPGGLPLSASIADTRVVILAAGLTSLLKVRQTVSHTGGEVALIAPSPQV